jgi:hypothetical protein
LVPVFFTVVPGRSLDRYGRVFAVLAGVARLQQIAAIILGIAFVTLAMPTIYRDATRSRTTNRTPAYYTSDGFLETTTNLPRASEPLSKLTNSMPPNKPVLILIRENNPTSSLLGLTLSYLAGPRKVELRMVASQSDGIAELAQYSPQALAAVAFCGLPAPAFFPPGLALGPNGTLIPIPDRSAQ